ncbi:MAG: hypothetical protein ACYTEO_17965 [Planctomycetota bacterium]|jgi:hypothetical protein
MTYIYKLKDPLTGSVRYVGKSDKPNKRLFEHLRYAPNEGLRAWITSLRERDLMPSMALDESLSPDTLASKICKAAKPEIVRMIEKWRAEET